MTRRKDRRQGDLFAPPKPPQRLTIAQMNEKYARHLMKPRVETEPKK